MATDYYDSSPTDFAAEPGAALMQELQEIQERYYQLHHDHELLRSSFDTMMADFADLEDKYKTERERSQNFHKQQRALEADVLQLRTEREQLQQEADTHERAALDATTQLNIKNITITELTEQVSTLQQRLQTDRRASIASVSGQSPHSHGAGPSANPMDAVRRLREQRKQASAEATRQASIESETARLQGEASAAAAAAAEAAAAVMERETTIALLREQVRHLQDRLEEETERASAAHARMADLATPTQSEPPASLFDELQGSVAEDTHGRVVALEAELATAKEQAQRVADLEAQLESVQDENEELADRIHALLAEADAQQVLLEQQQSLATRAEHVAKTLRAQLADMTAKYKQALSDAVAAEKDWEQVHEDRERSKRENTLLRRENVELRLGPRRQLPSIPVRADGTRQPPKPALTPDVRSAVAAPPRPAVPHADPGLPAAVLRAGAAGPSVSQAAGTVQAAGAAGRRLSEQPGPAGWPGPGPTGPPRGALPAKSMSSSAMMPAGLPPGPPLNEAATAGFRRSSTVTGASLARPARLLPATPAAPAEDRRDGFFGMFRRK
eukprot:m.158268 g.158268  ORF g.158268 m.158268 type:complete len:562 (+) comp15168_c4_seq60:50-1735(+)